MTWVSVRRFTLVIPRYLIVSDFYIFAVFLRISKIPLMFSSNYRKKKIILDHTMFLLIVSRSCFFFLIQQRLFIYLVFHCEMIENVGPYFSICPSSIHPKERKEISDNAQVQVQTGVMRRTVGKTMGFLQFCFFLPFVKTSDTKCQNQQQRR